MAVEIDQPPGARSCWISEGVTGTGGEWDIARDHKGRRPFITQREQLLAKLPSEEMRLLFQTQVQDKLDSATKGECCYGPGEANDVELMHSTQDVLELRLGKWRFADNKKMAIRIFFSEPVALPGTLLLLHLFWKVPAKVSKEEQTEAAKQASRLLKASEKRNWS